MEENIQNYANDPLAADFVCSMMIAAADSYRHDTVLRPFPPAFLKEDQSEKDFASLQACLMKLRNVQEMLRNWDQTDTKLQDLLSWSLDCKRFSVTSCDSKKLDEIIVMTKQTISAPPPRFVFQVKYNDSIERKFQDLKGDRETMFGFHGSRVENFHSILNHGLQNHLTQRALFGEGIYLTSELSVAMPFCPQGKAWDKSIMGQNLSCVAVCEIIDHPSVRCQVKEANNEQQRRRSRVAGSLGGEVPEKYYIVQNNELLCLRYVLVYASKSESCARSSWFFRHRTLLLYTSYAVMLLAVGLFNNKSVQTFIRKYYDTGYYDRIP